MRIHKYQLTDEVVQDVYLPEGARILALAVQHRVPCLWCLVQPDAPVVRMTVYCYGTGHPLPSDPGEYIGTVQLHGGELVLHYFRKPWKS